MWHFFWGAPRLSRHPRFSLCQPPILALFAFSSCWPSPISIVTHAPNPPHTLALAREKRERPTAVQQRMHMLVHAHAHCKHTLTCWHRPALRLPLVTTGGREELVARRDDLPARRHWRPRSWWVCDNGARVPRVLETGRAGRQDLR
jgi:hypothetical protein